MAAVAIALDLLAFVYQNVYAVNANRVLQPCMVYLFLVVVDMDYASQTRHRYVLLGAATACFSFVAYLPEVVVNTLVYGMGLPSPLLLFWYTLRLYDFIVYITAAGILGSVTVTAYELSQTSVEGSV